MSATRAPVSTRSSINARESSKGHEGVSSSAASDEPISRSLAAVDAELRLRPAR